MLGWFKADAARASCSKRWRRSGSAAVAGGSTLIGPSRPGPASIDAGMRYWERLRPITVDYSGLLARPTAGRDVESEIEGGFYSPAVTQGVTGTQMGSDPKSCFRVAG